MRAGGFLFIDEANRMPNRTLNVPLGVLSRRAVALTEHGCEKVEAGEGFQVAIATNLGQGHAVNVLEFHSQQSKDEEERLVDETG